jgi:hypothetical protein
MLVSTTFAAVVGLLPTTTSGYHTATWYCSCMLFELLFSTTPSNVVTCHIDGTNTSSSLIVQQRV